MSSVPNVPSKDDMVRADIVCPCHQPGAGCQGALSLRFPVRMFEPAGELEYRQVRQRAVSNFIEVFDEFYERVRADLMKRDELVIRPKRGGQQVMIVGTDDLRQASDEGNGKEHTT